MWKCSMWKLETLPTKLPPIEGQQKETRYPERPNDITRKGLRSGEVDEITYGVRDV